MILFEKIPQFKYIWKPFRKPFEFRSAEAKDKQRQNEGFTLIEIIVAVIIMGLAYVVILQSFSLSTRHISKVETLRDNLLQYSLDFEQQSLNKRLNTEEEAEISEDIFMTGSRYKLVLVSDESKTFMTLRLEKP